MAEESIPQHRSSGRHEWIDDTGTKWAAVRGAGLAPVGASVVSKAAGDEILRLAGELAAIEERESAERARIRPLLERCDAEIGCRKPSNPGSIHRQEQLLADLRRELGKGDMAVRMALEGPDDEEGHPYAAWLETLPAGELVGSEPKDTFRAFEAGRAAERARLRPLLLNIAETLEDIVSCTGEGDPVRELLADLRLILDPKEGE